jgi:hypothetical protein
MPVRVLRVAASIEGIMPQVQMRERFDRVVLFDSL